MTVEIFPVPYSLTMGIFSPIELDLIINLKSKQYEGSVLKEKAMQL